MTTITAVSFVLAYLMFLWFRADAFAEYMTLFRLSNWFHIHEYNELHREGYSGNYPMFLAEYYKDKFFVRLVTCPFCVSFWVGLLAALYIDSFVALLCSPLTLFFFMLFNRMS